MSEVRSDTPVVFNDIIIALVQPVGADLTNVRLRLIEACNRLGVQHIRINLTTLVSDAVEAATSKVTQTPSPTKQASSSTFVDRLVASFSKAQTHSAAYTQLSLKMHAGTNLRKEVRSNDVFAKYAAVQIGHARKLGQTVPTVYILDSLKHVEEVSFLRQAYGSSFYVVAVNASQDERKRHLMNTKGMRAEEAAELMSRDEKEEGTSHGQQSAKTFEQADFFANINTSSEKFQRFMELAFGNPHHSPERQEYFMHLAASASAMSSDLGRQVGALILDRNGELASLGYNEVPSTNGGIQAEGDDDDSRDKVMGIDPNRKRINEILTAMEKTGNEDVRKKIENLIEYHRTVHAELEAIIACSRKGISIRGGTLFTTTFPCHNCAKHIAAAGISEVVYVDDYTKSLAFDLHSDVMTLFSDEKSQNSGVSIRRFQGIGPRRYLGFFSQTLSTGLVSKRKDDSTGKVVPFMPAKAQVKYPVLIGQARLVEAVAKAALFSWKDIHGQNTSDALDSWLDSKLDAA